MLTEQDKQWMQRAIQLAKQAADQGEVPVGAVIVSDNQVIGEGYNQPIGQCDPSAHAEIVALRAAGRERHNYRLVNTTLYVTLEPCVMCVGAMVHARIQRVVYGAPDPKTGAVHSVFPLAESMHFNHRIDYQGGLFADECGGLLKQFFLSRRGS